MHATQYLYWAGRFHAWAKGDWSKSKAEAFIDELLLKGKVGSAYIAAYAIQWYAKNVEETDFKLSNIPRLARKIPETLRHDEADRLIRVVRNYNLRDSAMISLMYDAGLRVSELTGLNVEDVNIMKKNVFLRKRKGNVVPQIIPFGETTKDILNLYLKSTFKKVSEGAPLFQSYSYSGRRLNIRSVGNIIRKWSERILGKRVHPHTLRHSFAVRLRESGVDVLDIADLLGHQNIATTRLYARMSPGLSKERYISPVDNAKEKRNFFEHS